MDGLSAVGSGIAVISLSIQLVQSIDTIRTAIRRAKSASAEIERLARQLEVLKALLEDVRQMIEYQSSCGIDAMPMPSATIFDCLKGCERGIEPIVKLLSAYGQRAASSDSKTARLRRDMRLGLKTTDIAGFEDRIQQEVTRLNMALTINNTRQLHALQIFVERQAALAPKKTRPRFSQQVPGIIAKSAREIFPAKNSSANWRTWSRVVSTRQRFGIYRQEIAHRTLPRSGKTNESTPNDEDVPHEEVYLWACRFLGYGIRWSRHRLFKSVLPSISVYPTIYEFNNPSINRIMESGTVSDVQEFFRRGELHPFTRDCYGQSLLHVAALHHRSDICRLLGQIGLKADADFAGWTPTDDAVVGRSLHADDDIKVRSTLKSLAQDSYLIDGTDRYDIFGFLFHLSPENMVWCWKHRADILYYEDTSVLASMFVEALLSHLSRRETMTSACQSLKEFFSVELRHLLESGSIRVFNYIFDSMEWRGGVTDSRSFESFEIGEAFIRTIADVGVDVNGFIETEKAKLPTRRLDPNPSPFHETSGERSLVAEHIPHRGWKLGWKWQFDKSQPGYLLVTELTSLVVEPGPWTLAEFPFCRRYNRSGLEEARHWKARNLRFERRTAAKARKERARVGLKQPRGKMPGSWIS